MNYLRVLILALGSFVAGATALAHSPSDPPHQTFSLGDHKLESDESIRDFSMSYVTHGTLNANKSNAVLMVTSIGGNHHRIDYLIGAGKALDHTKYFIICTDAIGNGLTTSPSNSTVQPRMQFPKFNIRDMVSSQQRLVTEKFGIKKLVTVVGASMGGMQALQWAVSYPSQVDSIVPIIPLGRSPAWTTGVLEMLRKTIMATPFGWAETTRPVHPPNKACVYGQAGCQALLPERPVSKSHSFPMRLMPLAFSTAARCWMEAHGRK